MNLRHTGRDQFSWGNGFYTPFNILCIILLVKCLLFAVPITVASCLALEITILAQSPSSTIFTPNKDVLSGQLSQLPYPQQAIVAIHSKAELT